MAVEASSRFGMSTNPKPRDLPVIVSTTTLASSTSPCCSNNCASNSSSCDHGKLPTKILVELSLCTTSRV